MTHRLQGKIGIDKVDTVTEQQGKMLNFAWLAGLQNKGNFRPRSLIRRYNPEQAKAPLSKNVTIRKMIMFTLPDSVRLQSESEI